MKIVVELEIDQASYDRHYGPGSEWWNKYKTDRVLIGQANEFGPTYHNVVRPASDYEYGPGKPNALGELLVNIINEGLYDWGKDGRSWVKIKVDGKEACSCGKLEGHKAWCEKIAGPEASEA